MSLVRWDSLSLNEISNLLCRMRQTAKWDVTEDEGVLTIHSEDSHRKVYSHAHQGGVR
jgi:hypothetical protein